MYGSKPSGSPLNGLRLWSDWNSQVYQWVRSITSSKEKYEEIAPKHSGPASFSYMALHMEDLMHPTLSIRFRAIVHLAEWVGSSLTEDQLCCLANQDSNFMGSHERAPDKDKFHFNPVERYGKWKQKVANNYDLELKLNQVGGTGLKMLGYEPMRKLADPKATTKSGYRCTVHVAKCAMEKRLTMNDTIAMQQICQMRPGQDYVGGDIPMIAGALATRGADACCRTCRMNPVCKFFTYIKNEKAEEGSCYLKLSKDKIRFNRDTLKTVVSGDVI